jgi:predicted ATPase
MAEQLRRMADQTGDPLHPVEANRRLGWCLFCMGRIDAGRTYLDKALRAYNRTQSSQHIAIYGSDPGIIGHVNMAWLQWFGGRPDEALKHSNLAIELARELSYGLGIAYALGMSAALYQCLGDPETTATLATETIDLAQKHGFPYWVAWETGLLGWARTVQGQVDAGIGMLRKGLADYRATGAELFSPYMLGLLAQAHSSAQRFDDALPFCEEALATGERSDVHFFDAEILRLKGVCVLRHQCDVTAAQACFEQAVAIARDQGARMLELRALIALAMLHRSRGQGSAARRLLSEAVASFRDIDRATDLDEARRLLQEWIGEQ